MAFDISTTVFDRGEDDDSIGYCWHKRPYGKGPYCSGCGGLIKRASKNTIQVKMSSFEIALKWLRLPMHDQIILLNKLKAPKFERVLNSEWHSRAFKWIKDNHKIKQFEKLIKEI
jgi:hypothetical protein